MRQFRVTLVSQVTLHHPTQTSVGGKNFQRRDQHTIDFKRILPLWAAHVILIKQSGQSILPDSFLEVTTMRADQAHAIWHSLRGDERISIRQGLFPANLASYGWELCLEVFALAAQFAEKELEPEKVRSRTGTIASRPISSLLAAHLRTRS